jgi:hypothetical protein
MFCSSMKKSVVLFGNMIYFTEHTRRLNLAHPLVKRAQDTNIFRKNNNMCKNAGKTTSVRVPFLCVFAHIDLLDTFFLCLAASRVQSSALRGRHSASRDCCSASRDYCSAPHGVRSVSQGGCSALIDRRSA